MSSSESDVYETSDKDVCWEISWEDIFATAIDPLESCADMSRGIFVEESRLLLSEPGTR